MTSYSKVTKLERQNDWHVIVHGLDNQVMEEWDIPACTLHDATLEDQKEHLAEWVEWDVFAREKLTERKLLLKPHGKL